MKRKNAISLIVLVITIIVLSILAATVIITLSNTNIISQANNAVQKTEAQQIEEAKILMQADGMLGKNPESITIGDTTLTWNDESKTIIEKNAKDGTTKIDTVTIPSGFYYVGGLKNTGLVISDASADENKGVDYTCTGNQFVWVPVEYTATGTTDANGLDTGFTSVFKRGTAQETSVGSGIYKMTGPIDSSDTEPYIDAAQWEKDEYNAMMLSVEKNHGFYIARFEAGEENSKVVSKKNVNIYDGGVLWGDSMTEVGTTGAVYLSQNMYKDSLSVVSTLCYGVQWDAIMNFVSDKDHNIENPVSWGNYVGSTGEAEINCGSIQTTGKNEAWKARNIYDLAGNATEWTMEAAGSEVRYYRSGNTDFATYGEYVSPADRLSIDGGADSSYNCFRVALYIK